MRDDEIEILIVDASGKTFHLVWKNTNDRTNAIKWTLESGDLPHYVDVAKIIQINVIGGKELWNGLS